MSDPRLYHIYHSLIRRDYTVTDANKTPLYLVDNSTWTPHKPDLTVHAGTDNKAPVVAVSKFVRFSRHCKIGLGDPADANNILWEDLLCDGFCHGKFRWQMSMGSGDAFSRPAFIWKRTHHVGVGQSSPSVFATGNYKLVDEHTEQVLAVYTSSSHKSLEKSGKLEILVDYGQDFDVMALTTTLTLVEKNRRRNQARAAGGAGGGSS